jgi:tetratricopeptide (TPR) repeat protein
MQQVPALFAKFQIPGCCSVPIPFASLNRQIRFWCPGGLIFLVATIASASSPCKQSASIRDAYLEERSAARLSDLGNSYATSKNYACAAEAFEKAVALEPDSAILMYNWGFNLHAAGKLVQALDVLGRARKLSPQDLHVHLLLGTVLEQLNRKDDAETEWRDSLAIDAKSSIALDALSRDLIAQNDYSGVIGLLDKRSPSAALSAEQTVDLGTALAAVNRLGDAVQILQVGLAAYPDNFPISHLLGMVLMIMDRPNEASSVFELALRNHPRDRQTQTMYLQALVLRKAEHAAEQAKKVLALYPDDWQVLYLNAVVENRAEHFSDARRHLQRSIALNPSYAPAHAELGKVFQELGDLSRAKTELETAEALGDKQIDVHYQLARVLRSLGDKENARDKFREIEQLEVAGIDKSRATVKATEGDQAMATGNAQQAAGLYREALAITPDDGELHYKLAKALDLLHDIDSEQAELRRSVQLSPNLPEVQNQLGFLAVRAGDAQAAEEYFHAALKASPSYFVAWVNLAAALASEAKWSEAQEALNRALRLDHHNTAARDLQQAIQDAQNGR